MTLGKRSVKIRREHEGVMQTNLRTWRRNETAIVAQGTSARVRV